MAYPTGVAFKSTTAPMGSQPIHEASSTKLHELGTIVQATDSTYGEGEFIYLIGVASTAQGDLVVYNSKTGATTRTLINSTIGPAAVAMSACDSTSKYGWYQISGSTPVKASTVDADTEPYLTATAGQVDDLDDAGDRLAGATFKAATVAGYATVQLARPTVGPDLSTANQTTLLGSRLDNVEADVDQIKSDLGSVLVCSLSAAAESGNAIVVTGQVVNQRGFNVEVATEVLVTSFALTDSAGDLSVTAGTSRKIVNPATGQNVAWITTTAAGAFAVSVANTNAELTLVTATAANGVASAVALNFALV